MLVKKCSVDPKGQIARVSEQNKNIVRIIKQLRAGNAPKEDILNAIDCYIVIKPWKYANY